MMLVVLLIGITATFVNLNLQPDPADIARREAERFAALLGQLREESILSGRALAVEYLPVDREYRFLALQDGKWTALSGGQVFRPRRLPQPIRAELKVAAAQAEQESASAAAAPLRVVVDPVGEVDAFEFQLRAADARLTVRLDEYDRIAVATAERP